MDLNRRLIVGCGGEGLRLPGRDRGVARNHWRRHSAQGFDRQRQRSNVEQQQIFDLAAKNATLDSSADRDYLIRVYALMRFLAEQLFDQCLNARHAGLPADQYDFIDLAGINPGILHALLAGTNRALDDVFYHRFQFGPGQLLNQVLRARRHPP